MGVDCFLVRPDLNGFYKRKGIIRVPDIWFGVFRQYKKS